MDLEQQKLNEDIQQLELVLSSATTTGHNKGVYVCMTQGLGLVVKSMVV